MRLAKPSPQDVDFPEEIANLPTGHLHLVGPGAGVAKPFKTIAALAAASASGASFGHRVTGTLQARRVLNLLIAALGEKGIFGWDNFRKNRQSFVKPGTIYFYSPRLRNLNCELGEGVLAKLHLSRRAINALKAVGVSTIGRLIAQAEKGITNLSASGVLTSSEVADALDALSDALTSTGNCDWVVYAERRNFAILPEVTQQTYSARDFLWHFPEACQTAAVLKFGPVASLLVRERIFSHRHLPVTLKQIGEQFDLTKERIRLMERSFFKMMNRAIWDEEYRGCPFRFRPEFLKPLRHLADRLKSLSAGTLSHGVWAGMLGECWSVEPAEVGRQTKFLSQLLGVEVALPEDLLIPVPKTSTATAVRRATKEIGLFFRARQACTVSVDAVCGYLVERMGRLAPPRKAVISLLRSLRTLERGRLQGTYRLRIEYLRLRCDRAERVLQDRGMPMHFEEIYSEVGRFPHTSGRGSPRQFSRLLSASPKFLAIGRSGLWRLAEWSHIHTGTVADVAEDVLNASGGPLQIAVLFRLILPVRQVSRGSIGKLLREDSRFVRTARGTWALVQKECLNDGS